MLKKVDESAMFEIVTVDNLRLIRDELRKRRGRILIAEKGMNSFSSRIVDAYFDLYARPIIDVGEKSLSTWRETVKKRGEDYQTGYQQDRRYVLSLDDRSSRKVIPIFELEKLKLSSCNFSIHMNAVVGRGLFDEGSLVLYIPKRKKGAVEAALSHAISFMAEKINATSPRRGKSAAPLISRPDIKSMVDYAITDLKDGKVFRENIKTGERADRSYEAALNCCL